MSTRPPPAAPFRKPPPPPKRNSLQQEERVGLIHSIHIIEFDELKGANCSHSVPIEPSTSILSHSREDLAELCLPDGAHLFSDDEVYISMTSSSGKDLYGYVYFSNTPCKKSKRGARQISVLITSAMPYFDLFRPFAISTIDALILNEPNDSQVILQYVYDALNLGFSKPTRFNPTNTQYHVALWNRIFVLEPQILKPHEWGGASLVDLILIFREATMLIWYSLVSDMRLLFVGQSMRAGIVSNLVISAPLLLGPYLGRMILNKLVPYVTLANVNPLTRRSYVCGTTNSMIALKTQWYDTLADCTNGKITQYKPCTIRGNLVQPIVPYSYFTSSSSSSNSLAVPPPQVSTSTDLSTSPSFAAATTTTLSVASPTKTNKTYHSLSRSSSAISVRVCGSDSNFIRDVIYEVESKGKGEDFVRQRFAEFTENFLSKSNLRVSNTTHTEVRPVSGKPIRKVISSAVIKTLPGSRPRSERLSETFLASPLGQLYSSLSERQDFFREHPKSPFEATTSGPSLRLSLKSLPVPAISVIPTSKAPYFQQFRFQAKLPSGFIRECAQTPGANLVPRIPSRPTRSVSKSGSAKFATPPIPARPQSIRSTTIQVQQSRQNGSFKKQSLTSSSSIPVDELFAPSSLTIRQAPPVPKRLNARPKPQTDENHTTRSSINKGSIAPISKASLEYSYWVDVETFDGKTYYWNVNSNETTWENPRFASF